MHTQRKPDELSTFVTEDVPRSIFVDDSDGVPSVSPLPRHCRPVLLSVYRALAFVAWSPAFFCSSRADDAQLLNKGKWVPMGARTVSEVEGFTPSKEVGLSQYGGRMDRKTKATGFFRTEKVDGRWSLVDPEGYLFLSAGLCSVHMSQKDIKNTEFKNTNNWATATSQLLRSNGFNTLGCWSDSNAFQGGNRMPYTPRWNFMSTFAKKLGVTEPEFGHTGYQNQCMPIFHPDFEAFCDEHAKQLAKTKDDPWLLGHFSDNELPFRPNLLDLFLALPKDSHGYKAAKAWWDNRTKGNEAKQKFTEADRDAFLEYVAHRYYSIVGAAIRKHDPNHLFIGSRVHGACIRPATFRGSSAVDVVSVNYYHRWTPEADRLSVLAESAGRPFLISEWYAMAVPSVENGDRGAGFKVKSARDRGLFYQNFTLGLLNHPDCVGWHWFKYSGDDEKKAIGLVDKAYRPHDGLLKMMGELNRQLYPLSDFFAGAKQVRKSEQDGGGKPAKSR